MSPTTAAAKSRPRPIEPRGFGSRVAYPRREQEVAEHARPLIRRRPDGAAVDVERGAGTVRSPGGVRTIPSIAQAVRRGPAEQLDRPEVGEQAVVTGVAHRDEDTLPAVGHGQQLRRRPAVAARRHEVPGRRRDARRGPRGPPRAAPPPLAGRGGRDVDVAHDRLQAVERAGHERVPVATDATARRPRSPRRAGRRRSRGRSAGGRRPRGSGRCRRPRSPRSRRRRASPPRSRAGRRWSAARAPAPTRGRSPPAATSTRRLRRAPR